MNTKGTELKKHAVALRYQPETDLSPQVIGSGKGFMAEEIIKKAKEHKIPIQEDKALVELLSQLEVNQAIPTELYEVVAEIFAFIYRIDQNG
ncbi:EscU/YscU/HrcU family type III secretion system export apparatus switch protein [Alkalihalobacillus sp. MEB130]|uniref:EscU/YscU/HrcU family type III secretion system export apparatus switch protein n=1 Tax=Alkalihalobacillus sp. MEB130 TaxID=2976704 RepID=UPI0028DEA3D3|nr:EscU/YscU/HrcU family type III secretion system export apparatus switch protein [Alkalihalobacillus sp. MEB130]MDT8859043.1 EscU/YscU/HrcU family type III secretion system export apparatus switch protein [Alkalihalobacillus sp. MEB130]